MTHAELDDERSFLLDSLEDLERERAAGDLSEADYSVLRDRYTRRAAEVLRALARDDSTDGDDAGQNGIGDAGHHDTHTDTGTKTETGTDGIRENASSDPRSRRPRPRRGLVVGGSLALVAAAALTIAVTQTGTRLPGQTGSGSVSLSPGAQERRTLLQAEALQSGGNAAAALRLYQQILAHDPNQPDALAQSGWLEFEAGVRSKNAAVLAEAQSQEQAAQRVAPGAYAPHLYLGSMFLAEGNAPAAVEQYRRFLADGPPPAEVQAAQAFVTQAFRDVGQPVPAPSGASATTTAPSSG